MREKGGEVHGELSPCTVVAAASGELQGDAATCSAGAPFCPKHSSPRAVLGRRGHVSLVLLTLSWSEPWATQSDHWEARCEDQCGGILNEICKLQEKVSTQSTWLVASQRTELAFTGQGTGEPQKAQKMELRDLKICLTGYFISVLCLLVP